MGLIRNHAIVVSGWKSEGVRAAHEAAERIFHAHLLSGIVSPVINHRVNAGAAFFVSPDGSKEGWSDSERGNEAREELKEYLRNNDDYLDWCEIELGGDEGFYRIVEHAGELA